MKNSYFQFKQFKIEQAKSHMKVCTDSCLFGAWVARKLEKKEISPNNILDIGAGTGLLSLMLAQKSNAKIDAVEIDQNAFEQTRENFSVSPWNQQLQVFHNDITKIGFKTRYDLIISNPPFFEGGLKSNNNAKNVAKHQEGLTLKDLIAVVKMHLSAEGKFSILLPFHRSEYFKTLAFENDLLLEDELLIRQTPTHSFFREILFFGKSPSPIQLNELTIREASHNYSVQFIELLKDYYLYIDR